MSKHRPFLTRLASLAVLVLSLGMPLMPAPVLAAFPDRPIRIVLGFAPGGGSDILLRAITPALGEALGQVVVVDNRPGAAGNLAMVAVAQATPDGYTLLMGTPGLATNPSLYPNAGFDPLRDFAPVSLVGSVPNVLIVRKGLPANSVSELIPASSTWRRPVPAHRSIWRANCSWPRPASRWCTSPTRAVRRR